MEKFNTEELKILAYMSRGYNNLEIGKFVYKSIHTVKIYVRSILRKLGAKNRTEAVFLACQDKKILDWILKHSEI